MTTELILYTNPMSRGRIARWALEETGTEYKTEILEYATSMKADEYLALNPMGKVPAIRHGDQFITEGAAICAYLADAFPEAGLAPQPEKRGAYYRWLFFASGPLEAAIMDRALGLEVPPERERSIGYGNFALTMDTLEHAVSQNAYIAGDQFTLADVYFGSQIGWGLQFKTVEERPGFAEYWARVSDRPAYRRAAELDDALIPQEQS